MVLFTDHNWWKNLLDEVPVTVHLNGKKYQGRAEVIYEHAELSTEELLAFVWQNHREACAYVVKLNAAGQPDHESACQVAQQFTIACRRLI